MNVFSSTLGTGQVPWAMLGVFAASLLVMVAGAATAIVVLWGRMSHRSRPTDGRADTDA